MPFYVAINEDRSCYLYWQVKYCAKQDPRLSTCLYVYMSICLYVYLSAWRLLSWLAACMPVNLASSCLAGCLAARMPVCSPVWLYLIIWLFLYAFHTFSNQLSSSGMGRTLLQNTLQAGSPSDMSSSISQAYWLILPSSRLKRKSSGKPSAGMIPLSSPTR